QGGKSARPIWSGYMTRVYRDKETGYGKGYFERPSTGLDMTIDCSRYSSAGSDTIPVIDKPFEKPY
ncbi:MAG TPA: hypothetical protein VD816_17265, partial [Ohtaekwangia sp.]|nr:hypothetical protein [Ohtaekwangia sp.]